MKINEVSNEELIREISERLNDKMKNDCDDANMLVKQLAEVNCKLNEAEAIKSNFISNVTNEIVNPFTSILGLSKNILALQGDNLEKAKSMASLIQSEAFNLDLQLKNIFAAAKFEAGQSFPDYSNVDVNSLINSIISVFEYRAEQKQISIQFDYKVETQNVDAQYVTDPEKLKLIISNLLSNSIKYTNAAKKININSILNDNELVIKIEDEGIGIDEKNMQVIFDRFKRANLEINSLIRGHGLGLSVVKACLDILGGEIKVKSKIGHGTLFTIIIPIPEGIRNTNMFAPDSNEVFFNEDEIF